MGRGGKGGLGREVREGQSERGRGAGRGRGDSLWSRRGH